MGLFDKLKGKKIVLIGVMLTTPHQSFTENLMAARSVQSL